MGNRGYDFRIKQSSYEEALEAYNTMLSTMELERQKQLDNIRHWNAWWVSGGMIGVYSQFKYYLEEGDYEAACDKIRKMCNFLEETIPQVKNALGISAGFVRQLYTDDYVEPPRAMSGTNINGGVLALNYDAVKIIIAKCDEIVEQTNKFERDMRQMIYECSHAMDGMEECMVQLTNAANKLRRVGNYRDALQAYSNIIMDLDFEARVKMTEIAGDAWAWDATKQATEHREEMIQLMGLNKEEAGLKAILSKDPCEWTRAEHFILVRAIGKAIEERDSAKLEAITEGLVCIGNTIEMEQYLNNLPEYSHYKPDFLGAVRSDREKVAALMAYVNPYTNPSVAAYLSQMLRFEIEVNPCAIMEAASMEDFVEASGLADYEGDAIDNCVVFDEDGNMAIYIRPCPDGKTVDFLPKQQIYTIMMTKEIYPCGYETAQSTGVDLSIDIDNLSKQFNDLTSDLSGTDKAALSKFFCLLGSGMGEGATSVATSLGKDYMVDAAQSGLEETGEALLKDVLLEALGPVDFVIDQCQSISGEMMAWARQNQENLEAYVREYMRVYNENLRETAELLSMNIVTAYSGQLSDCTMDEWQRIKKGEMLTPANQWENINSKNNLMENTYVGLFEGEGQHESTADRIKGAGGNNERLEKILKENADIKGKNIQIVHKWLEEKGKEVQELTFKDYLEMNNDPDVIRAVRDLLDPN